MTTQKMLINLTVELSCFVLCALGIVLVLVSSKSDTRKADKRTERYSIFFYSGLMALAASNMTGLLMRGRPGMMYRTALSLSNYLEFFLPAALVFLTATYLLSIIDPEQKRRNLMAVFEIMMMVNVLLLIVSQFTGLYYIIDSENLYRRQTWYPLSSLMTFLMMSVVFQILLKDGKKLKKKERVAFWIYFFIPFLSIAFQNLQYGLNVTLFSSFLTGLAMYIFIISNQTERYYQQKEENAQLKVELMLQQIQPHFLYNALGAIQELCDSDPQEAKRAVMKFARYLRGNMDSITETDAVPFPVELEHTKIYLQLEQMRFEDALRVRYDIQGEEFSLPTLTLQPLAENAVIHGVRGVERDVGTVTVATREYPDRWEVSVTDDGPGFDPDAPAPDDGRRRVGLQNVRERLKSVCGGALRIESQIGTGTKVSIILPKRKLEEPS